MTSPKRLARIAGVFYLMMAIGAGFAELYARSRLVKSGDAATTATNIRDSAGLFRAAFVADLLATAAFLFTAMALYLLFKHVHQLIAAAMVTIVGVSVAIQSLNLLNHYTALNIATDHQYSQVMGQAGADQLVMMYADMQHNGFLIAQMFFGLWLLPLGYLVIKSGYFPKVLGWVLVVASASYLIDMFMYFLTPALEADLKAVTGTLEGLAEMAFMLWLLIVGVRVRARTEPDVRLLAQTGREGAS